jgi:hypothetical protein
MARPKGSRKEEIYEAPLTYVGLFYGLLLAWVAVSVYFLGKKNMEAGWAVTQLVMIGFVIAYTWYFSLGISYRIILKKEGGIRLKSFRKALEVQAKDIDMIEGPRFGLPIGFIRFRLAREKAYLFCVVTDVRLKRILWEIRSANPDIKVKDLSVLRP